MENLFELENTNFLNFTKNCHMFEIKYNNDKRWTKFFVLLFE